MLKAVLFDLDGTLLPMDQSVFIHAYMSKLAAYGAPHGFAPEALVRTVWAGTGAMVKNDGSRTNREAFWETFETVFPARSAETEALFTAFYQTEFDSISSVTGGKNAAAIETVASLRRAGLRLILATNPVFPREATKTRVRWSGLDAAWFEMITTYENSRFCKPNPAYYAEIARTCGLAPADCLMVGNDAEEDMAALRAGMRVFLLTDCLLNEKNLDISRYPQGGFAELRAYIETL